MKQQNNRTMKNLKLLLIYFISLFFLFGCNKEDESYRTDDYDDSKFEDLEELGNTDEEDIELNTGINDVILTVGASKRAFRYYMPENIKKEEPVNLFFYFHGNIDVTQRMINPYAGFSENHILCAEANNRNTIVIYPAGEIYDFTTSKTFGWNDHESNALFVDTMIKFFKDRCETVKDNSVYITGQSSGAIFCFGLSVLRSEKIGAAMPMSGQYAFKNGVTIPSRVVPIRAFNGVLDASVYYYGAYNNFDFWAREIGGCTNEEVLTEVVEVTFGKRNYTIDAYKWQGCENDLELYAIRKEGHFIRLEVIAPLMWDFIENH